MINPRMLKHKYTKVTNPRFPGGKLYFVSIGFRLSRVGFRRSSEAEVYAKILKARWIRLYDAAIRAEEAESQAESETQEIAV